MKKLLFAALLVLGLNTQVNAFFRNGNRCCGQSAVVAAPSCATRCSAPACDFKEIVAEKPRCVKYVEVEEPALCHKETITTFSCPAGTTEAEACA